VKKNFSPQPDCPFAGAVEHESDHADRAGISGSSPDAIEEAATSRRLNDGSTSTGHACRRIELIPLDTYVSPSLVNFV
jgi:hypothetical protein